MLVDEVQKGGTITEAAKAIREAMDERGDTKKLSVAAFQDTRHGLDDGGRNSDYLDLAAGEQRGVEVYVQSASMFMVDRTAFLDEIWKAEGNEPRQGVSLEDFTIVKNDRARSLFRTLAEVSLYPQTAIDELEGLQRQALAQDLGSSVLQQEVLEAMTDPVPVRGSKKQANDTQMLSWWKNYAKACLPGRPSANLEPANA
jgi:hypothetical protein